MSAPRRRRRVTRRPQVAHEPALWQRYVQVSLDQLEACCCVLCWDMPAMALILGSFVFYKAAALLRAVVSGAVCFCTVVARCVFAAGFAVAFGTLVLGDLCGVALAHGLVSFFRAVFFIAWYSLVLSETLWRALQSARLTTPAPLCALYGLSALRPELSTAFFCSGWVCTSVIAAVISDRHHAWCRLISALSAALALATVAPAPVVVAGAASAALVPSFGWEIFCCFNRRFPGQPCEKTCMWCWPSKLLPLLNGTKNQQGTVRQALGSFRRHNDMVYEKALDLIPA